MVSFSFGNYDYICRNVQMALCSLVGQNPFGTKPACYARNIEINGLIVFQAAALIANLIAIIMTLIMIWHVSTKYTAVGRKEMTMVFYLYLSICLLDVLTISGFITYSSPVYPYFVAGYLALTSAMAWCLMLNGFIGFQWAEDGTFTSLLIFRFSSLAIFAVMYFVSIATFKDFASFSRAKPVGVFSIYFIFNTLCLIVYLISQVILVVNTLDEYWPLGNILFAAAFFIIGQVIQLFLSNKICDAIKHYVDGLFFTTICTLLAVMMVYKYWDSITKEDLEFSVGGKGNVWEVKDVANYDDEFAPYVGQASTTGFASSQQYINYGGQQYQDDKRGDQQAYYQQQHQQYQ